MEGMQREAWKKFYEIAWKHRADFMLEYIKKGYSPYQAIKLLEKKERKYALHRLKDDACHWEPMYANDNEAMKNPSGTPLARQTSCQGNYLTVPFHVSMPYHNMLADIIDERGPFDSVTELGCGYGRNIFELFYGGLADMRYLGGEYTESGVNLANEFVKAEPRLNASFFHFDHLNPVLDMEAGERALVFTCHSIEQVTLLPEKWFSVVAGVAPHVTCVHFEPFGFQAKLLGKVSEAHRDFFRQNGWNLNFVDVLRAALNNKVIELDIAVSECFFPTDPNNPTSRAVWHKDS